MASISRELGIVIFGVVMEGGEPFGAGGRAEREPRLDGRMAPPFASHVILDREGRVIDHEIAVAHEVDHVLLGGGAGMLEIAHIGDGMPACVEAISGRAARMAQGSGAHAQTVLEAQGLAGVEADEVEMLRLVVELDRKERRREHGAQRGFRRLAAEIAGIDLDVPVRLVERGEEGKPDDVVLVQMAEQDVEGAFGPVDERISERREAAARIDDEQSSVDPDFDASGIAAVNERARAGNRDRASDPEKAHTETRTPSCGATSRPVGVRVSILPMILRYLVTAKSFALVASRRRARSRITARDICGNWRKRSKNTSRPILSATTCEPATMVAERGWSIEHAHLSHHRAFAELGDLDAFTARAEPDLDLAFDDHIGRIGDFMLVEQDVALCRRRAARW